jgi:hypothetical protein
MIKTTARSYDKPLEIDTSSSNTTVYIRENITEKQETRQLVDGTSKTYPYYEYDETQYDKDEYLKFITEQNNKSNELAMTALKALLQQ